MISKEKVEDIYKALEGSDEKFLKSIRRLVKLGVSFINNTEELREELVDSGGVYQT